MSMKLESFRSVTEAEIHELNRVFADRAPEELLSWAAERFAGATVLTCSFGGVAGMALLDMIVRHQLPITILFLDTNLLFAETYALIETVERRYGITVKRQQPALSLAAQAHTHGPELYARDPDRCCGIRKVAPLAAALRPHRAWISGIRRDQTAQRAATALVTWNNKHGVLKLNPLSAWSEREVWAYINAHDVPYNPLLNQGYPSLGCTPCTRPAGRHDPRGGRWSGFAKTECGIHT